MSRPKVILLGDSIRMSYQPIVAEILKDEAEVVGPSGNCCFTLYTLTSLPRWFDELGTPDIVHWNNGIHDAGYNPGRAPQQIPLDDYVGNLRHIANRILDNRTKKLIFATSTPPHPDRPFSDTEWGWKQGDIERYNASAVELMAELGVPVNDLHGIVRADIDGCICEDQLHLSEEGKAKCAGAVAEHIRKLL